MRTFFAFTPANFTHTFCADFQQFSKQFRTIHQWLPLVELVFYIQLGVQPKKACLAQEMGKDDADK